MPAASREPSRSSPARDPDAVTAVPAVTASLSDNG